MVQVLNKWGLKCTFNLNSGRFGTDRVLPADELPALYQGHEVAVHTLTHPHLENITLGQIAYEVSQDRKNLETLFGCLVEGMAYPFGLNDTPGQVETLAACGIRYSRTTLSTHAFDLPADFLRWHPTCHHDDAALPQLAARFFAPEDWQHPWRIRPKVLYVWGHSYEFENRWQRLDEVCALIGGRQQEAWYATNGQIADYVHAFRSLRTTADGSGVYNPTSTVLYLNRGGEDAVLEPGKCLH